MAATRRASELACCGNTGARRARSHPYGRPAPAQRAERRQPSRSTWRDLRSFRAMASRCRRRPEVRSRRQLHQAWGKKGKGPERVRHRAFNRGRRKGLDDVARSQGSAHPTVFDFDGKVPCGESRTPGHALRPVRSALTRDALARPRALPDKCSSSISTARFSASMRSTGQGPRPIRRGAFHRGERQESRSSSPTTLQLAGAEISGRRRREAIQSKEKRNMDDSNGPVDRRVFLGAAALTAVGVAGAARAQAPKAKDAPKAQRRAQRTRCA